MNSKNNLAGLLVLALAGAGLAGCDSVKDVRSEPSTALPDQTVVLQGTISGIGSRRSIVLTNNGNVDGAVSFLAPVPTEPTSGAVVTPFSFGTVPVGSAYNIEIRTQPYGKQCSVAGGAGTISAVTPPDIRITCADNVPRYSLTVNLNSAFASAQGARVQLTTEEAVYEQTVTAGQATVVFPSVLFNASTAANAGPVPTPAPPPGTPTFTWTVTASTTVGGTLNKCPVTNATNPTVSGVAQNPSANITNVSVGACSFTVSGAVAYSVPSTGGAAPAMPTGGLTVELRNTAGQTVATQPVTAFGSFTFGGGTPTQFQSNSGAVFEVVVASQPTGMFCMPGNGSYSSLYVTGLNNPVNITSTSTVAGTSTALNIYCRAIPATNRQLRGTYRLKSSTWTASATATPLTSTWDIDDFTVQNRATSAMLTFFESGSFLYGTHASTNQVEQGFYDYDPVGQTLRFTLHTDTNTSTTFPAGFNPGSSNNIATPGISAAPGPVVNGGVSHRAMVNVVKTSAGALSQIAGTFGPGATTATAARLDWVLEEPHSVNAQMTGTWATQDHRRFWVYDLLTYYGTHVGVVGGGISLNDACFTMEDVTAASSFYTRRGSITGCYPWNRPSTGQFYFISGQESIDFVTPSLTLIPGWVGRMPGGQAAFDGRSPSPIYFHIAPAASFFTGADSTYFPAQSTAWCATEILGVRETLHGNAINYPVYFCRTRAN